MLCTSKCASITCMQWGTTLTQCNGLDEPFNLPELPANN